MRDLQTRLARLKFRAWHRGTREADYVMGGFFDRYHGEWDESDVAWFEALLDEEDVDVMDWAMSKSAPPERFGGAMMESMRRLDFVEILR